MAEKNYPQLELEAMVVDYTLQYFCQYLVGSQADTLLLTISPTSQYLQ